MEKKVAGTVLTIAGLNEFTAANAGPFRTLVCAALDGHTVVEVDLSQTTAMDCGGLGALIAVRNLARSRKGGVRLVGAPPAVRRLFDVLHAGDQFEIVDVKAQEDPSFASVSAISSEPSALIPSH
jgi:anti-anti-sigma factor